MIYQKIELQPRKEHDREEVRDAIFSYLYSLYSNGQVFGSDPRIIWDGTSFFSHVETPQFVSTSTKFNTKYTDQKLEKLKELAGSFPSWTLVEGEENNLEWAKEESLYLYTHAFDNTAPVCASSDGFPIPVYKLGLDDKLRWKLMDWFRGYQRFDRVYLHSAQLEVEAYRELVSVKSSFTREGLELRKQLEQKLEKPVYYYLFRAWGYEDEREVNRKCPGCGGDWKISDEIDTRPFNEFQLKCVECRLLSHHFLIDEDEELAIIGTFEEKESN